MYNETLLLQDVHFSYGEKKILKGITFSLKQGEIVSLIGLSGSGKTTLFRLITGLAAPLKGEILQKEEGIAYLEQEDLLLPWRTILENILLLKELGKKKVDESAFQEKALYLLKRMGLSECTHLYPFQLSGGMRQRVSLARALLQGSSLILLDEPFESLDVLIREELYALLKEMRDQFKKTMLFVSHDFRDAFMVSDRILLLGHGQILSEFLVTDEIRFNPSKKEEVIETIRSYLLKDKSKI